MRPVAVGGPEYLTEFGGVLWRPIHTRKQSSEIPGLGSFFPEIGLQFTGLGLMAKSQYFRPVEPAEIFHRGKHHRGLFGRPHALGKPHAMPIEAQRVKTRQQVRMERPAGGE